MRRVALVVLASMLLVSAAGCAPGKGPKLERFTASHFTKVGDTLRTGPQVMLAAVVDGAVQVTFYHSADSSFKGSVPLGDAALARELDKGVLWALSARLPADAGFVWAAAKGPKGRTLSSPLKVHVSPADGQAERTHDIPLLNELLWAGLRWRELPDGTETLLSEAVLDLDGPISLEYYMSLLAKDDWAVSRHAFTQDGWHVEASKLGRTLRAELGAGPSGGSLMAIAHRDNVLDGAAVSPLEPTAGNLSFSPDRSLFVFYQPALGMVASLAARDGGVRGRLPGDGDYGPVSWSQDGTLVAYVSAADSMEDAQPLHLYLVSVPGREVVLRLQLPPAPGALACGPQWEPGAGGKGRTLLVLTGDGLTRVEASSGKLTTVAPWSALPGLDDPEAQRELALAPQRPGLTYVSDGSLLIWDGTGQARRLPGSYAAVSTLRWSPDGKHLACAYAEGLKVIAAADGKVVWESSAAVYDLAWSPAGDRLAVSGPDELWLLDLAAGQAASVWARYSGGLQVAWADATTIAAVVLGERVVYIPVGR